MRARAVATYATSRYSCAIISSPVNVWQIRSLRYAPRIPEGEISRVSPRDDIPTARLRQRGISQERINYTFIVLWSTYRIVQKLKHANSTSFGTDSPGYLRFVERKCAFSRENSRRVPEKMKVSMDLMDHRIFNLISELNLMYLQ